VCLELKYESIRRGEFVFRAGDYGEKFYLILDGEVAVQIALPANKGQKPPEKKVVAPP
jgi:CRP-like cAMP-binding protein